MQSEKIIFKRAPITIKQRLKKWWKTPATPAEIAMLGCLYMGAMVYFLGNAIEAAAHFYFLNF